MAPRAHPDFLDLAAARLAGPLPAADEARLEAHLAACTPCREQAAGYATDRAALHALREALPPPPRDLWARTAAALDRESARRSRLGPLAGIAPRRLASPVLVTALSLLLVASIAGLTLYGPWPSAQTAVSPSVSPGPTPFGVEPELLAFVSTRDGTPALYAGRLDTVCPESTGIECPTLDRTAQRVVTFSSDFVPERLAVAPNGEAAAVVGRSTRGDTFYAVTWRLEPDRTPEPPATATPATPEATPEPTPEPTASPEATPKPTPEATPEPTASPEPTPTPRPTLERSPTPEPATPEPTPEAATPEPTPEAPATVVPISTPAITVAPDAGKARPILEGVIAVGETPAYSPDGSMLAFSAMPADGSTGPDIYVWHPGDEVAQPITGDHASIFASWAGERIVGSQAVPLEAAHEPGATPAAEPRSFVLDPATGETREIGTALWRPIVDPQGHFVVYWAGTLAGDGRLWRESTGGLYLADWRALDPFAPTPTPEEATPAPEEESPAPSKESPAPTPGESAAPKESPAPDASVAPKESPAPDASVAPEEPTPSPSPAPEPLDPERDYTRDPIVAWEVRWSPDGRWLGAWIGDPCEGCAPDEAGQTGHISVVGVDPATGRIERDSVQLREARALRGFALGDDRAAWSTMPEAGRSSELRVLTWGAPGRGVNGTRPDEWSDLLPGF